MKKMFSFFLGLFFLFILVISFSNNLMKLFANFHNSKNSIFGSDKYRYGDLYGLSYLKDFKFEIDENSNNVALIKYNTSAYNLFIAGDSYLGRPFVKSDSIFCGVNDYWYSNYVRETPPAIKLPDNQRNILVIETVERNLLTFADTNVLSHIVVGNKNKIINKNIPTKLSFNNLYIDLTEKYVYNPGLNENLEYNLFDYRLFTPLKEFKANLNDKVFNRVNNDVVISPDRKYLFYAPTVDTTSWSSAFIKIEDADIERIVNSLNVLYKNYREAGFDEVYFSIMPNPVTILSPDIFGKEKYNKIITRIESNRNLNMPVIDVYELFKHVKMQIYFNSDTHWNANGFRLWVNEFNRRINEDQNSWESKKNITTLHFPN